MEFGFTEEQEKLRKEVHDFFMTELPEDYEFGGGGSSEEVQTFWKGMTRKAIEKGYYVPGWPEEYGGSGMTSMEQGILDE